MTRNNENRAGSEDVLLAVVSAYGAMSEPDSRYRIIIKPTDRADLEAKFRKYIESEINRALGDEEIMDTLEELDPEEVMECLDLSELSMCADARDVIAVMGLGTDYHLEYVKVTTDAVDADAEEFIVMTGCGYEGCGPAEFPEVIQVFSSDMEESEQRQVHNYCGDPDRVIIGTTPEIFEELIGCDRHLLKTFRS